LADKKHAKRFRGGLQFLREAPSQMMPFAFRQLQHSAEKEALASEAVIGENYNLVGILDQDPFGFSYKFIFIIDAMFIDSPPRIRKPDRHDIAKYLFRYLGPAVYPISYKAVPRQARFQDLSVPRFSLQALPLI